MDINGAFLHGHFENGEIIHMTVPKGFEEYYPADVLLQLLRTMYGLKQAAMAFWRELLKAMYSMGSDDPSGLNHDAISILARTNRGHQRCIPAWSL